jgi:hypothetical protein
MVAKSQGGITFILANIFLFFLLGNSMGKQQKKWENGTKGLKIAKSLFFPDSRHDFKKKKVLQQSSKI